jgi:hypothetical protein
MTGELVGGRRAETCVVIPREKSPYRVSLGSPWLCLSSPSPRERNRAAATPNPNGLGRHLFATCWSRGKLAHFSDRHDKNSSVSIPWPAEASPARLLLSSRATEESPEQTNCGEGRGWMADRSTARLLRRLTKKDAQSVSFLSVERRRPRNNR